MPSINKILFLAIASLVVQPLTAEMQIEQGHIFLEVGPFGARATELWQVTVTGDPLPPGSFSITVPPQATDVKPITSASDGSAALALTIRGSQALVETELPAGNHELGVTYVIAVPRGDLVISKKFDVAAKQAFLLVTPADQTQVNAPGWAYGGVQSLDNRSLHVYRMSDVSAGFETTVNITRQAVAEPVVQESPGQQLWLMIAPALLLNGLLFYQILTGRRRQDFKKIVLEDRKSRLLEEYRQLRQKGSEKPQKADVAKANSIRGELEELYRQLDFLNQ